MSQEQHYKKLNTQIKSVDDSQNVFIEGMGTTTDVDSDNEVVDPTGAIFSRFQDNPILLFNHNPDFPIGKIVEVRPIDTGIYFKAQISKSDYGPLAYIRDLIQEGILKTFSIGFFPFEDQRRGDGATVFTKWQLNELSVVTLPANPTALFNLSAQKKLADRVMKAKSYDEAKRAVLGSVKKAQAKTKDAYQDCVGTKIPKLLEEGKTQEQAVAIAIHMCENEGKCQIKEMTKEQWKYAFDTAGAHSAQKTQGGSVKPAAKPAPKVDPKEDPKDAEVKSDPNAIDDNQKPDETDLPVENVKSDMAPQMPVLNPEMDKAAPQAQDPMAAHGQILQGLLTAINALNDKLTQMSAKLDSLVEIENNEQQEDNNEDENMQNAMPPATDEGTMKALARAAEIKKRIDSRLSSLGF